MVTFTLALYLTQRCPFILTEECLWCFLQSQSIGDTSSIYPGSLTNAPFLKCFPEYRILTSHLFLSSLWAYHPTVLLVTVSAADKWLVNLAGDLEWNKLFFSSCWVECFLFVYNFCQFDYDVGRWESLWSYGMWSSLTSLSC